MLPKVLFFFGGGEGRGGEGGGEGGRGGEGRGEGRGEGGRGGGEGGGEGRGRGGEASLVPTDSARVPRGRGGGGEMGKILAKYSNGQMLPFASSSSHSIHKFQGFCQSGAPTKCALMIISRTRNCQYKNQKCSGIKILTGLWGFHGAERRTFACSCGHHRVGKS